VEREGREGGEGRREGGRVWGRKGGTGNTDPPISNTFRHAWIYICVECGVL